MLFTITAAEILYRHERESLLREHALLASHRERRAAEASRRHVRTSTPISARAPWARPIGVKTATAGATCAA